MSWCTIESDPGVFTELISQMGVKGVQVEELYSLSADDFRELEPVYGFVFLFKWQPDPQPRQALEVVPESLFFARQVIEDACATQAILSVLLNCPQLELGPTLNDFRAFTTGFSPEDTGLALSNSDVIRQCHNSFARPEPIIQERVKAKKGDDAFHFIGYVHHEGVLYELDGLQRGPISHGACTGTNWLDRAAAVLQERVQQYEASEVRFNLMAITRDRRAALGERLSELAARKLNVEAKLQSLREPESGMDVDEDGDLPATIPELETLATELQQQAGMMEAELAVEQNKFARYRVENIRRRHNYVPFLVNFLRVLAEKGELTELVEKARTKAEAAAGGSGSTPGP